MVKLYHLPQVWKKFCTPLQTSSTCLKLKPRSTCVSHWVIVMVFVNGHFENRSMSVECCMSITITSYRRKQCEKIDIHVKMWIYTSRIDWSYFNRPHWTIVFVYLRILSNSVKRSYEHKFWTILTWPTNHFSFQKFKFC